MLNLSLRLYNVFNNIKPILNFSQSSQICSSAVLNRLEYVDWKMIRDVKRRNMVKEYAFERINIYALRKNDILPREIKDIGSEMVAAHPRDASYVRVRRRCVVTSRPRGLLKRWRLSRIVFRLEVDYNRMSGIQRAIW